MRLIDADELAKVKFHALPYTHITPSDLTKMQTEAYERGWNDAIDAIIENAETIEQQRWIPVTERLPEKNGDYYVTYEKGYAEDYGFDLVGIAPYDADCEGFGIWQERYDPVSLGYLDSYFVDIKVTAWMPYIRPKPWKGESNE